LEKQQPDHFTVHFPSTISQMPVTVTEPPSLEMARAPGASDVIHGSASHGLLFDRKWTVSMEALLEACWAITFRKAGTMINNT
jgi:hypothetical protein